MTRDYHDERLRALTPKGVRARLFWQNVAAALALGAMAVTGFYCVVMALVK